VKFIIENEIWNEEVVNVCGEPEISIEQLTQLIAQTTGYTGNVLFDKTRPNGARRKMLDDSYLRGFGWNPVISLKDGFAEYYKSYIDNL